MHHTLELNKHGIAEDGSYYCVYCDWPFDRTWPDHAKAPEGLKPQHRPECVLWRYEFSPVEPVSAVSSEPSVFAKIKELEARNAVLEREAATWRKWNKARLNEASTHPGLGAAQKDATDLLISSAKDLVSARTQTDACGGPPKETP
jgi:hypothetical protein